jgi:hypothetical protein
MNAKGIPVPTIRDPKTGFGSISLTLVFLSSVIVIAGIIGKSAGALGGLDMNMAMEFFWTSTALYFGRQFQTKSGSIFGQSAGAAPQQPQSPQGQQPSPQPKADDPDAT